MRAPAWLSIARYRLRLATRALFPGRVRHYGDDGTIHRTGEVNVELHHGRVVAVWFRCALLPFTQEVVGEGRARDMEACNRRLPRITAVDFVDPEPVARPGRGAAAPWPGP